MLNFKECEKHYTTDVNHWVWYEDKKTKVFDKLHNLIEYFQLASYDVRESQDNNNIYLDFNEDFLSKDSIIEFKELTYYLTYLESDVIFEDENRVVFEFEDEDFLVCLDRPTEFYYFTV